MALATTAVSATVGTKYVCGKCVQRWSEIFNGANFGFKA
jgi:hypothetical protein